MKLIISQFRCRIPRWASLAISAVLVWALLGVGFGQGGASASGLILAQANPNPTATCPEKADNAFTMYRLLIPSIPPQTIISPYDIIGYACGGPGEQCDSENRPYYRPSTTSPASRWPSLWTMAAATSPTIGTSLVISTTAAVAVRAQTQSDGAALRGECLHSGVECYSVEGVAPSGDYAGHFSGRGGTSLEAKTGRPSRPHTGHRRKFLWR